MPVTVKKIQRNITLNQDARDIKVIKHNRIIEVNSATQSIINIQKTERKTTLSQDTRQIRVVKPNRVIEVNSVGRRGLQGLTGESPITVSATPPVNPQTNDLWVDLS